MSSKRYRLAYAPIEDSDQPVHLHILIRVINGGSIGSQGSNVSNSRVKIDSDQTVCRRRLIVYFLYAHYGCWLIILYHILCITVRNMHKLKTSSNYFLCMCFAQKYIGKSLHLNLVEWLVALRPRKQLWSCGDDQFT